MIGAVHITKDQAVESKARRSKEQYTPELLSSGLYLPDVPSYQSFQNLHKQNDYLVIKIHIQNTNL